MFPPSHEARTLMIGFALAKGAIVAAVTLAIGTTFGQSLLVAVVSGGLGMAGMIGAAFISTRQSQANRELLHDIKRKIGAAKRAEDEPR